MYKDAIYLVDGTSICYRSFFAIKLSTSKGVPSGAVYGFFKTVKKILSKYNPSYIGICFDVSRKTFRQDKYKEYKINRPPLPEGLRVQIPLIKQMVKSLGIALVEKEGFEADDIIATISKDALRSNKTVVIVSMDKDMYQLISQDKVVVYNPNQDQFLNEDGFLKENGFMPEQMVDFLSLTGDSVDNIPGAKGVGKVGAAKLIKEFKTIEHIFNNLDKISPKLKDTLEQSKKDIFLSKDLVKLRLCDLNLGWEDLKMKAANYPEIYKLFTELEFKSLLKDMPSPALNLEVSIREVTSPDFLKAFDNNEVILFIQEANVSIFNKKINCIYKAKVYDLKELLEDENIKKISYDFKPQILSLEDNAIRGIYFDVKIAGYLIDPSFADYELSTLIYHYLGEVIPEVPNHLAVVFIQRLYDIFSSKLKEEKMDNLFFDVEMPLVYVLAGMERAGVKIDREVMEELSGQVDKRLSQVSKEIFEITGKEFNLNSHQQLREVLFGDLKIAPLGKTKTGFSTGEEVLSKLAVKYPIAQSILEYRQLNKLKTTYISPLSEDVKRQSGRLYAKFNQTATQTGRLSSSSPNLQSIPAKGEFSSHLRKAFVSSFEDGYLLSADYSQIELRILAHFSGDDRLIEGFKKGLDIHKFTAALLFNTAEEEVEETQRNIAKRVNFGIIYGMSYYGLAKELDIKPNDAMRFIEEYFSRYPKVAEYIQEIHQEAESQGFVKTLLGRKRNLPDFNSTNTALREFSHRQATNTPIQGSCADLIKIAMVKIYKELKEKNLKTRLIIQIHDELILDVPGNELDKAVHIVRRNMEESIKLSVPIEVNIKAGKNWAEMKEISGELLIKR